MLFRVPFNRWCNAGNDTVEKLQHVIVSEWDKLSQRFIDFAINEWRRRLECVVQ